MKRIRQARGILLIDVVIGLMVLGVASLILIVAISRQSIASARFADARRATRAAESVIAHLQAGLAAPQLDKDVSASVKDLPDASSVPDWHWIDVTVKVGEESRSIAGLVPTSAHATEGR